MQHRRLRHPAPLVLALIAGCGADAHGPLVEQLGSADAEVRREAAAALGGRGAEAAPAVPALVTRIDDAEPSVRQAACRALGEIGVGSPPVTQGLQSALEDRELSVRLAAAFSLLKLDPGDEACRRVLIEAMREGEGGTIVAIGRLKQRATWALPALITLLRDRRAGIRRISAEALGRIGPDADAVAALKRAAEKDPDDRVRETATAALAANSFRK